MWIEGGVTTSWSSSFPFLPHKNTWSCQKTHVLVFEDSWFSNEGVVWSQWDCLLFDLISNLSQILNYLPLGKLVSGFGLCQPSKFSFFSRIDFICKNKVIKNAGGFIFFLKPEIEARIFWHRAGRPELEGTVARIKDFWYGKCGTPESTCSALSWVDLGASFFRTW